MPLEFFRDILDEHLPEEEVQRQIETALNWGRYAEIFTYDSETDRLHCTKPQVRDARAPLRCINGRFRRGDEQYRRGRDIVDLGAGEPFLPVADRC